MPVNSKITPINPVDDDRAQHKVAVLNGRTHHYLLGQPENGEIKGTVFLIHGWPDLWAGWRYQIPFLIQLGFRVVAPDMLGYGGTDAPQVPPNDISLYGMKAAADDIAQLAAHLSLSQIILGGHDWGGIVVWRVALWHPELISHVFSVCSPFTPPSSTFFDLADVVKRVPQFAYQLHLAGPEVEATIQTPEQIRQFIKGLYGGRGPSGEVGFDPNRGLLLENLPKLGDSRLLDDKVLDYYTQQYARNGLHGPLNWYRTRKINYEQEQELKKKSIDIPTLFIQANKDSVLKPELSAGMEKHLSNLTRGEIDASHWALIEMPDEVNAIIESWLLKEGLLTTQSHL